MKTIRYAIALTSICLLSCGKNDASPKGADTPVAAEEAVQAVSKFVGKWAQIDGDQTVAFVAQGDSLLFKDGAKNFKAERSSDKSVNVDLSSMSLGIVVFEYSQENDTISAMGDTFRRQEEAKEDEQGGAK